MSARVTETREESGSQRIRQPGLRPLSRDSGQMLSFRGVCERRRPRGPGDVTGLQSVVSSAGVRERESPPHSRTRRKPPNCQFASFFRWIERLDVPEDAPVHCAMSSPWVLLEGFLGCALTTTMFPSIQASMSDRRKRHNRPTLKKFGDRPSRIMRRRPEVVIPIRAAASCTSIVS